MTTDINNRIRCLHKPSNQPPTVKTYDQSSISASASADTNGFNREKSKVPKKPADLTTAVGRVDEDITQKSSQMSAVERNTYNESTTFKSTLCTEQNKPTLKITDVSKGNEVPQIDEARVHNQSREIVDLNGECPALGDSQALPDDSAKEEEQPSHPSVSGTSNSDRRLLGVVINNLADRISTSEHLPDQCSPLSKRHSPRTSVLATGNIRNGKARRISKRHKSTPRQSKNNSQTPTVSRALGILQWAWEQEKEAIEAQKVAEIESFRQISVSSERTAAESAREAMIMQEVNAQLRVKFSEQSTKFESLSRDFNKICLFTRGLGNDLSRDNGKLTRITDETKSLEDERKSLRSDIDSFENQQRQNERDLQELRRKYGELLATAESSIQQLQSDIAVLQIKIEEKDLLLAKEKEINISNQTIQSGNRHLHSQLERLLTTTEEHLMSRLQAVTTQQKVISNDEGDLAELKTLLKEVHSRNYIAAHDLRGLEVSLDDLSRR
jgi:hypothetical protein